MPPVSEAQRKAMYAAREGRSTLGIPKKVGEEFVGKDALLPKAAGICYVDPEGRVLLLKRSPTEKNYAEHWAFPGGSANEGESAMDAANRESKEEIGYVGDGPLKVMDRVLTPNGMTYTTFARPVADMFAPKLNGEHCGYQWATLDSLPHPMHPQVKRLLGDHIGARDTADMDPDDWECLRHGFAKWTREEQREPQHANDMAMDRALYDARGKRIMGADRIALDKQSVRRYDADGMLHIDRTPISKANIGEYYGHEIPGSEELGLQPQRRYRLLRHPDELKKGAKSANGKQVMLQHIPVSADDHQPDLTVGAMGTDAEYKHPFLYNSMTIHARPGIDAIESGEKKELSCGYRYVADMTPGTYEGEAYDGVMRDIDFNHVALVEAGRAGADVLVLDQLPRGEVVMSKIVLSRKGTFLAGACAAYLQPRLAQDAQIDITPIFKGVSSKNFAANLKRIAMDIRALVKPKLARDAELDHIDELLEHLGKQEVEEGLDTEPNSGLPMTAEEKKAKDEEEKKAADKAARDKRAADRKAAFDKFKHGRDAETCKAMDDLMGELDGMDGESERAEENEEGAEGGGGEDNLPEPKVTKKAMDAAIAKASADATAKALKTANEIAEAKEFTAEWVGKMAMDAMSPVDVYSAALTHLGVDVAGITDAKALRRILEAQPKPGATRTNTTMAVDSAIGGDTSGFSKRFGTITDRIAGV